MDALDTSIAPDASIESDTSNVSTASKQWPASLNLDFYRSAHRSHVHRSHRGPLRIQRPFYPEGDVCHVILLHPPGGLVSGDRLDMTVSVGANAHAVVTAPGAMKHYRARIANANHARMPDHIGMVNQCIDINNGALEWMPNESIHYDGSVTRSLSQFNLFNHAKVLSLDVQVFGRQAGQHDFLSGKVDVGLNPSKVPVLCVVSQSWGICGQVRCMLMCSTYYERSSMQHPLWAMWRVSLISVLRSLKTFYSFVFLGTIRNTPYKCCAMRENYLGRLCLVAPLTHQEFGLPNLIIMVH